MNQILTGKTVLLTGGTGSIGSQIVTQAVRQQAKKVIVFSRDEIKHFILKKTFPDVGLETFIGDVRDSRALEQVFSNFDIDLIFHAAAMKHVIICEDFPLEAVETNIIGSQNVVDMVLKHKIPKMITISTDKAVSPANVMGATKFIAERITLNANKTSRNKQAFSCVRFGNVSSSRGSVIPTFVDALVNRRSLTVSDPEVTRFIMDIPDAVRLVIKASSYARGGEIFMLKMKTFKLGDLVDVMATNIAPRLKIKKKDIKIKVTGLIAIEKRHEELMSNLECTRAYELDDMYVVLPDNSPHDIGLPLKKANFTKYTSENGDLLSKDDLERMVLKYVEKYVQPVSPKSC